MHLLMHGRWCGAHFKRRKQANFKNKGEQTSVTKSLNLNGLHLKYLIKKATCNFSLKIGAISQFSKYNHTQ